jgi:hypothetical protein
MKLNQLKKTYSQLNQRELALLAFDGTVRNDDKELSAITCCMPKQHCTVNIDAVFNLHFRSLFNLSYIYGLIYWKTVAYGIATHDETYLNQLIAIDAALVTVCDQMNISIESVRTMAQCKNMPLEDVEESVSQEMIKLYVDMFMSFFV